MERDQLVDGNAKLETTKSAAQILGPGFAGVLIGLFRAPFAMVLDSLSYLWSAAFILWIRRPEPPVPVHDVAADGPRPSMRTEIAAGLRYVTGQPWLRAIATTTGLSNLFTSIGQTILVLYLVRERGLSAEAIGIAFSAGSTGVLLAAVTVNAITRRVGVGPMLVLMAMGFSVSLLPVAAAPDALVAPALALSGFIGGFCGIGWNINQVSLRQAITPARMQGRMNASMRFIVWGTIPVGSIASGVLGTAIGLHQTVWVGAICALFAFVPVALSPVRSLRTMPDSADVLEPAAL